MSAEKADSPIRLATSSDMRLAVDLCRSGASQSWRRTQLGRIA